MLCCKGMSPGGVRCAGDMDVGLESIIDVLSLNPTQYRYLCLSGCEFRRESWF